MTREEALEREVAALQDRVVELEGQIASLRQVAAGFELPGAEDAPLTPAQRAITQLLYAHKGTIISKQRIHHELYALRLHDDEVPHMKIVDVLVCKIRQKIEGSRWLIETSWGIGYRLTERQAVAA